MSEKTPLFEAPRPACCEAAVKGDLHCHSITEPLPPPAPLTEAELTRLAQMHREAADAIGTTWKIAKEGRISAAMGGATVVFYADPCIEVKPGAVVVGCGCDWGGLPVPKAAELVASIFNALPRLLAELQERRNRDGK
jgi:hypothetical protein